MVRRAGIILFSAVASLLLGGAVASAPDSAKSAPVAAPAPDAPPSPVPASPVSARPAEPPPTVDQALRSGVLIVVSKAAQKMYVFKDGEPWGSSPVSTGRRGHATPSGVFPILQKKVRHRSNLYSGAPMPYMQRLTWGGVALHAGHVPGYPASHGCIRMPGKFARSLYGLTSHASTVVVVANERLRSHQAARQLASGGVAPLDAATQLARAAETAPTDAPVQTIQLAASSSPEDAAAYWRSLQSRLPRLAQFDEAIIPAVVNGRQVYRLRASAPGAHALCGALQNDGIACLRV